MADKIRIASQFLADSPPGEFNDVFADVRVLVNDDALLQQGIVPAFQEYNCTQFVSVPVPEKDYHVIICKEGQIDNNTFLDPRSQQRFTFDHLRQVAQGFTAYAGAAFDTTLNALRQAIDKAVSVHVADHYAAEQSHVSVFARDGQIHICLVANKYNASNFWNGRWRSHWTWQPSSGQLSGVSHVHVHYYEDGNVQLQVTREIQATVTNTSPDQVATELVKQIRLFEDQLQQSIGEAYAQLAETTFKQLRRALPVTRNKIDWHKILNYKVGAELASAAK